MEDRSIHLKKKTSNVDRLFEVSERYPSQEKFILYRNLYLGASAACLVLIAQLLDTGVSSFALKLSLSCASGAMPVWLLLAAIFEYYVILGPKSYAHKRIMVKNGLIGLLLLLGGLALGTAVGGVLYHLHKFSLYVFIAAVSVAFVISLLFHWHLAEWYFDRSSEDESG